MSGASGAYPQKIKRKRYSTESGVNRDLSTGSLGPMAQEAGRSDKEEGVYRGGEYDDDSSEEEEEEEEEERPVKKRKGPPVGSACREQGCDKWAALGGLCTAHGGATTRKPCLVEGCGTLAHSRGLCVKHGGDSRKPCSVDGCDAKAYSGCAGMCTRHFKEMK